MHSARVLGSSTLMTLLVISMPTRVLGFVGGEDTRPLRTRTVQIDFQTTIDHLPAGTETLHVWIPFPNSDENQEVFDVEVETPVEATMNTEPFYGNSLLHLSMDDQQSPPYHIRLRFKVHRREYLRKDFPQSNEARTGSLDPEIEKFLKPTRLVPITKEVREWAREVTEGKITDQAKARAIYDYAISILKYDKSGEGWGRGDLLYACDVRRGNCTDFHALFTGFTRALGIPARFSIGLSLPAERGQGEISGYHCWAEFYSNGYGWVPIDASEAWKYPAKRDYFFGGHDENRVQFSVGRDVVLRPRQEGRPLNYFVYPYVEADGIPVPDAVSFKFFFNDIPNAGRPAMTED